MKIIILCAGVGSRISKAIGDRPKCLLEISGKAIIEHQLDMFKGYTNVPPAIVVGYKQEMIREKLKNRDVEFVENPQYATTNILASLWYALGSTKIDDDILCLPGDLIFDAKVIKDLDSVKAGLALAVQSRPCDSEAVKVLLKNGTVAAIGKAIQVTENPMEFLGMLKVGSSLGGIFKKEVDDLVNAGQSNAYMFTAVQRMIDKGIEVGYADVGKGAWEEIDFYEDYTRAQEKFKGAKWQS